MLDPRRFRQDPEAIAEALKLRGFELDLATYHDLEDARHKLQTEVETLQHERNVKSKHIGVAKQKGENIDPLVAEVGDLGTRLDELSGEFHRIQDELQDFLLHVPNLPDASVPSGESEEENEELRVWGERPVFDFKPKDHVEIAGTSLDFEASVRISGSRFSVLKGELAKLHRCLIQFMLDVHISEHGYEELYVPFIVNRETMTATGQLPKFEDDVFFVRGEIDRFLIPTAEVPITNMVREQILDASELPIRYVSHTPCFRRESGSHGKDTRGLIRVHQFEKVELVQITHPETSWTALEELTNHAETILRRLELPYRAVVLCGGDLGFAAAKTIDLEVWLPGFNRYREVSSCSNFVDFQARRAQARFRPSPTARTEFVHTLNGSGLAIGRTLLAILENNQQEDGTIRLPEALVPYMGGVEVLKF
ncbi:MAG: serine--tRNA ligase [Gammaproteobacteria bacterium]|nr:serine--tRNA ligase [Gammaproteobacteria bacterium]MYI77828.1 serine--tRNA ligase [Gammaproteobacteria bacterium]